MGTGSSSGRAPLRWYAVAASFIALIPLLIVQWPPLVDYLPHLSRALVETSLLTDGRFADRFVWNLRVVPNLGFDAVVVPLALLGVPLAWAGKAFIALVILANGAAVAMLHRTLFGRRSPVALLAFAFSYTELLMYGFLTSELAVAFALIAYAIYLRGHVTASLPRLLAFVTASVAGLFFIHMLGAVVFLGLIGSDAVSARWRTPRLGALIRAPLGRPVPWALIGGALAAGGVALCLLFALAPVSASNVGENAAGAADFLHPKLWRWRLIATPLLGYDPAVDLPVLGVLGAALLVLLLGGRVRIAGRTMLALAGLAAAYFFAPAGWGSTYYIPERFPFILMLLGLASIDVELPTVRARHVAAFTVLTLVMARSISAAASWQSAAVAREPMFAALARTQAGDRVCQARNAMADIHGDGTFPFINITSYATLSSGAFAYIFALPDQNVTIPRADWLHTLRRNELNNRVDHNPLRPLPEQDIGVPENLALCDYVLVTRPTLYQRPLPEQLEPIVTVPGASLFRIARANAGTQQTALRDALPSAPATEPAR